jgi:hypothetical protein
MLVNSARIFTSTRNVLTYSIIMELQSWTKPLRPFHAANITVIDHDKTNFVSPHGGPHQFNDNVVNNAVTTFGKIP